MSWLPFLACTNLPTPEQTGMPASDYQQATSLMMSHLYQFPYPILAEPGTKCPYILAIKVVFPQISMRCVVILHKYTCMQAAIAQIQWKRHMGV